MYLCRVSWMICVGDVMYLGRLLCSWYANINSVAARADRDVTSLG